MTAVEQEADTGIRPFKVTIAGDAVTSLRRRLGTTRRPSPELVDDPWEGVQSATIQPPARNWATEYDLRRVETRLNALPQFTTAWSSTSCTFADHTGTRCRCS